MYFYMICTELTNPHPKERISKLIDTTEIKRIIREHFKTYFNKLENLQ
jgi:hypothetical protein